MFGGLLERARTRMREARVAAEVRALGSLSEGEGLTALAPRFLLAPLRIERLWGVGPRTATQDLILLTKDLKGKTRTRSLYPVRFVPLTGSLGSSD